MKLTKNGRNYIQDREGLRLSVYRDVAGVPTIGYGATRGFDGRALTMQHRRISLVEASELFRRDIKRYETSVAQALQRSIPPGSFDALVSLCYNIGRRAFARSTCLKLINKGDINSAAEALTWWNKITKKGKKVKSKGLVKRRESEKAQFLLGFAQADVCETCGRAA